VAARMTILLVAWLAACALPARETDRSTPVGAFRTFRGAIAREEYEREWGCLSNRLRANLGMSSRLDWKDARTVALNQDHKVVKGLSRAKISGPSKTLPDGRVRLPFTIQALFVRVSGTLTLRREVVLRAWVEGETEPLLSWRPPELQLEFCDGGLGVALPEEDLSLLTDPDGDLKSGMKLVRFEAARIWFLDGFTVGEQDAEQVKAELASDGEETP
jgi:hypothetical protein